VEVLDDQPTPATAGDSAALAYRLSDDQVWVQGSSTSSYSSLVVEVLNQAGLQDAAQWEVVFDPAHQRLRIHHLDVYRDGAWTDRLASAQGSVLQRESELSRRLYDERLSLLLLLEDVRVGDLVRFSYTLEGRNPILGERYAASFYVGYSIPVAELRVRFRAPAGEPLFYRLHGTDLEPEKLNSGRWQELLWHREDVAAIPVDDDAPPDYDPLPMVQVSQFESWAQVSEWGRELYPPQPLPEELQEVRDTIASEHRGPAGTPHLDAAAAEGRFLAASRWVQDEVRYFGILLGHHSHAPHDVADIARRRYGDCKDKTRLLITLLGSLGIEAWPALVDSSGTDLQRYHPSPLLFDHVVTVARLPQGEIWIDPTLQLQGGDLENLYFPRYRTALELRPEVNSPTLLPAHRSLPGRREVHHDYRYDNDADSLTVAIRTTFEGAEAESQRADLDSYSREEIQDSYVEFYTLGERTVEPLAPLEIEDDREANRLVITESYRVVDCWQPADDGGTSCDLLPLTVGSRLTEPARLDRTAPLRLPPDLEIREVIDLRTPAGWDLSPVEVVEQNPWFDYQVSSTVGTGRIEVVFALETLADRVEPKDLQRYVQALGSVGENDGYALYRLGNGKGSEAEISDGVATAIGCGFFLVMFLGAVGVVVGLVVFLRRSGRSAPAGAAGTCRECRAPLPAASARFCSRCGAPVAGSTEGSDLTSRVPTGPGRASKPISVPLVILGAAAALFLVVAIIGIVAAIAIPNFTDALSLAKQKRTLADLRGVADSLESFQLQEGHYPAASDAGQLVETLSGTLGLQPLRLSTTDGWERAYVYQCWTSADQPAEAESGNAETVVPCDDYRLASSGADGNFEHQDLSHYEAHQWKPSEDPQRHRDLVIGPDGWVTRPSAEYP
jgi:type II secretory pathway pseudopilin PulG/transglutaminase-like putative cysteine protease